MQFRAVTLLTVLAIALRTAPGAGQQPAAQQPPPQAVFRSGVELVRLDVRVVDGDGRPIKDLRPEEVRVTEGSEVRPLLLFQHIAEPSGPYVEAARRTISSEVSTNQGAPRGHLYVLVFDQNHITVGNEQRARLAAQRFLTTSVRPGDRVALYAIPGPGPQISFSRDPLALLPELVKVRGSLDRQEMAAVVSMNTFEAYEITRGNATVRDAVIKRAADAGTLDLSPTRQGVQTRTTESDVMAQTVATETARTIVSQTDGQSRAFLLSLAEILRRLTPIEGRKSVILVSEGFFVDNLSADIEQVTAAAAQAYAVMYTLDINRRGVDVTADAPPGAPSAREIQSRLEPLGTLAADTDGELILDALGRMDAAFASVAAASQDYYLLGFEPSAAAKVDRDRYRRINISVSRPGTTVHARSGYSLPDPSRKLDRRTSIDAAFAAPFPQTGVPVEVTTYIMRGTTRGVHRVMMSLQADLPLRAAEAARADVVFVVKSAADGRVVASGTDTMLLPGQAAGGQTTALSRYQVQFDASPGDYLMRVVVREPGGALGTADRRFTVAALDGVDVAASDLVVGPRSGTLPVRPAVRSGEPLAGVFEIYARRPADLERVDVKVDVAHIGGATPVVSGTAVLSPIRELAGGAARAAQIDMELPGINPGSYLVTATVRASGETVSELTREIEVIAAGAAPDAITRDERVRPVDILQGELGKRLLQALAASEDRKVAAAASAALAGNWAKVGADVRGGSFEARTLRGVGLFASDRMGEAAAEMDGAISLPLPQAASQAEKTERAQTAFLLGWAQSYAGKPVQAITAWRLATVLDPRLVSPYLALADAYLGRGEPALAAQVLQAGLSVLPESSELKAKLEATRK